MESFCYEYLDSIASKNSSPIIGMDTRWRAGEEWNNHIYYCYGLFNMVYT